MRFRRNRDTPVPQPHPSNCGLQTFQTEKQVTEESKTRMVPDTSSPEYTRARQNFESDFTVRNLGFNYAYAKQEGKYIPETVTVEKTTYLGTLTCRQMEKKNIEPVTGEGETPEIAAANVGKTVAALYCRTCPYFGKDQLQAAQYDAEVARAERNAVDQILAAEQARQEIASINQRLELPPAQS